MSLRTAPDPAWLSQQSLQEAAAWGSLAPEPSAVATLPDLIDHYFLVISMTSLPADVVPGSAQRLPLASQYFSESL